MDKITQEHRSWNMSRIKGRDTSPELMVRKYLYSHGLRYRVNVKIPGKPDIAIKKIQTAVFINGCFWHGHKSCKYAVMPKSNSAFWQKKITDTALRDQKNAAILSDLGWNVITIWECELAKEKKAILENLYTELKISLDSVDRKRETAHKFK